MQLHLWEIWMFEVCIFLSPILPLAWFVSGKVYKLQTVVAKSSDLVLTWNLHHAKISRRSLCEIFLDPSDVKQQRYIVSRARLSRQDCYALCGYGGSSAHGCLCDISRSCPWWGEAPKALPVNFYKFRDLFVFGQYFLNET